MHNAPRYVSAFGRRALCGHVSSVPFAALVLGLCLTTLSAGHPPDEDVSENHGALDWQIEPSHTVLSSGETDFYVRVRIKAAEAASETRQALNLSIVFDRSGSMNEESKIGYVRQAGHLVTDNLTRDDHVAFVAYSDRVQVLVPLHRAVNREYLHHRIDELFAEGHTNLSGGLLEGCAQLQKRLSEPGVHHVILLTDGLANRGVTGTEALVQLVNRCTQNGITLTTIGVGTEYNEQLLSRIAQAGGGRYVYVSEPDKIPAAFQQELGSLLDVVAQNATLKIPLPEDVEARRVFGREEPLKPGAVELPLGDLASGEERVLLIKLRSTAVNAQSDPLDLPAVLVYDDVDDARRMEVEHSLSIQRAAAATTVSLQPNPVLAYARLVEAVDKIALAVQSMDRNLAAQVFDVQQRQFPAWKQMAKDSHDQDFYNKAFMFEHYARELQDLIDRGALHEHNQARARLQKELHYRQYLMQHHGHPH